MATTLKEKCALTTDRGTDYIAGIVLVMTTTGNTVPESWRHYYYMFWGVIISIVLWFTRGHEALRPHMQEPESDDEYDDTTSILSKDDISRVLREGRK